MHFTLFTLFPEMFPGYLGYSLAGDALKTGKWGYNTVNIREFGLGKHRQVDDAPYGGGAGLVMRPDVLGAAIESSMHHAPCTKIIYLSPRGTPLTQNKVQELSKEPSLGLLCGRFEGVDERVLEHYQIEEISAGDYILSGGEPAALLLMDAVIRILPNVLGNEQTHEEESFSNGLLEYPHYTRPAEWNGKKVPDVLTSGNHAEVAKWRQQKALEITKKVRPDLIVG
jgi:tRNA (guanine37-N1)-methyltransferase